MEYFNIKKFLGVDYTIPLTNNLLIIIGENGDGKSKLLRFIYLLITKQWNKLADYDFDSVEFKLGNQTYVIKKDNLSISPTKNDKQEIISALIAKHTDKESIIKDLFNEYDIYSFLNVNSLVEEIELKKDLPKQMLLLFKQEILNIISLNPQNFSDWKTDCLFLPTYRRIEKDYSTIFGDIDKRLQDYLESIFEYKKGFSTNERYISNFLNNSINANTELDTESTEEYTKSESHLKGYKEFYNLNSTSKIKSKYSTLVEKLNTPSNINDSITIVNKIESNKITSKYSDLVEKLNSHLSNINNSITIEEKAVRTINDKQNFEKLFSKFMTERNRERWTKNHSSSFSLEMIDFGVEDILNRIIKNKEVNKEIFSKKFEKFKNIIKKYIPNKEIEIDENDQIYIKENSCIYVLDELSSGEKQILAIFSHLLFEEGEYRIVIIDEPEISLSIRWQETIIKDIKQFCKLLIIATHSPFIVNDDLIDSVSSIKDFIYLR